MNSDTQAVTVRRKPTFRIAFEIKGLEEVKRQLEQLGLGVRFHLAAEEADYYEVGPPMLTEGEQQNEGKQ